MRNLIRATVLSLSLVLLSLTAVSSLSAADINVVTFRGRIVESFATGGGEVVDIHISVLTPNGLIDIWGTCSPQVLSWCNAIHNSGGFMAGKCFTFDGSHTGLGGPAGNGLFLIVNPRFEPYTYYCH